jgi:ABC-type polysaccharide/polyol phosphate transport system ATPase subunit
VDVAVDVQQVCKSFAIPSERRTTIREHALALFRPRRFRQLRVLDGVTFELRRGETLGIMGRNGSGKSTLLKIIAGIYQPDEGRIVRRAPLTPILELGVGWSVELDARDNIELVGTILGLTLRQLRAAVDEILEFAGLREFAELPLKHYSSGMSARLAYAIAFRAVREVLILDEVFAVGDAEFRERCYDRFRELHRDGHTILLVSHNPTDVERACDRALLLEEGVVRHEGTSQAIAEAYVELLRPRSSGVEET